MPQQGVAAHAPAKAWKPRHEASRHLDLCARRPLAGKTLAGVAAKAVGEFYFTSAAPELPSRHSWDWFRRLLEGLVLSTSGARAGKS